MKHKTIVDQQIKFDEKTGKCFLITKYTDTSISSKQISTEEAARWEAEHKY